MVIKLFQIVLSSPLCTRFSPLALWRIETSMNLWRCRHSTPIMVPKILAKSWLKGALSLRWIGTMALPRRLSSSPLTFNAVGNDHSHHLPPRSHPFGRKSTSTHNKHARVSQQFESSSGGLFHWLRRNIINVLFISVLLDAGASNSNYPPSWHHYKSYINLISAESEEIRNNTSRFQTSTRWSPAGVLGSRTRWYYCWKRRQRRWY